MSIIDDHMIEKVINVHEEIKKKLKEFVTKYKIDTDKHRHFKPFAVGKLVMVHLQKDIISIGAYNKLK